MSLREAPYFLLKKQKKKKKPTSTLPFSFRNVGFPGGSAGKELACNAVDLGLIPGLGRSPGEGNGNPLQDYSITSDMQMTPPLWQKVKRN